MGKMLLKAYLENYVQFWLPHKVIAEIKQVQVRAINSHRIWGSFGYADSYARLNLSILQQWNLIGIFCQRLWDLDASRNF